MAELVSSQHQSGFMPVDALGMPYGIVTSRAPGREFDTTISEHHAFYRRRHPKLAQGIGHALRLSRTHDLPQWQHDELHRQFSRGLEEFPETEASSLGLLVLSVAGYLAREGLVLSDDGQFELRELTDHQYAETRSRHRMHPQTSANKNRLPYSRYPQRNSRYIYTYMGLQVLDYVFSQDLSHMTNLQMTKDFLAAGDRGVRHHLGRHLLREAVSAAVDHIRPVYAEAKRDGLIRLPYSTPLEVVEAKLLKGSWGRKEKTLASALVKQG